MEDRRIESWVQTSLERRGYELKRFIGIGAFGRVYLVENRKTGGLLACKSTSSCQAQKLLGNEAKLLQQIRHPLFVRYEKFWEEQQGAVLLMEYVEGESLAEQLLRGALSQRQALDYTIRLAEGLQYLHEFSTPVLYRDLKPENIKVGEDGAIKLLDLGCACKITEVQLSKAGTRGYAPPEQLLEGQPGVYSDVYALGKLFHYMLTGDNPCPASAQKSCVQIHSKQIRPYLKRFIESCTAADYRERIQDMNCVLRNLQNCGSKEAFLYERIEK